MRLRVEGRLAQHAVGLAEDLAEQGYTERSIGGHLRVLAHLDAWLVAQRLAPEELTDTMVDGYLEARRAHGQRQCRSRRGFAPVLHYLRTVGAVPPPAERSTPTPFEPGFIRYLEDTGATRITTEAALRFATQPATARPIWWAQRLSAVRGFARYVYALDPMTDVPPTNLLSRSTPRAVPYPYSPGDITALMAAARSLRPTLRAATYEALIGLLAVTGMRVAEVIALDRRDVDLDGAQILVRSSKFDRDRLVPLHPSSVVALKGYACRRDELRSVCRAPSFFVSIVGTRLSYGCVNRAFAGLTREVGLKPRSERCRPRLHDFRHRFAIETLLGWYRSGTARARAWIGGRAGRRAIAPSR